MRLMAWLFVAATGCGVLGAEERDSRPQQAPVQVEAPPTAPDTRPRTVRLGGRRVERASRQDLRLGPVRAVEMRDGEATLVLPDGQRTVRPGDVLSGDTVKLVEPGRMVLTRPDPQGGVADSIVIVRFDSNGRGRVTVYAARDTTPQPPPASQ